MIVQMSFPILFHSLCVIQKNVRNGNCHTRSRPLLIYLSTIMYSHWTRVQLNCNLQDSNDHNTTPGSGQEWEAILITLCTHPDCLLYIFILIYNRPQCPLWPPTSRRVCCRTLAVIIKNVRTNINCVGVSINVCRVWIECSWPCDVRRKDSMEEPTEQWSKFIRRRIYRGRGSLTCNTHTHKHTSL